MLLVMQIHKNSQVYRDLGLANETLAGHLSISLHADQAMQRRSGASTVQIMQTAVVISPPSRTIRTVIINVCPPVQNTSPSVLPTSAFVVLLKRCC